MAGSLILASSSETRQALLRNAGVAFEAMPARIDEIAIREAMVAEGTPPLDIADALAELKARKLSGRHPGAFILGCDQVLAHKGDVLSKPENIEDARQQLQRLRGETHQLLSAAVIYRSGEPMWRHVGVVRLTMHSFSETYLEAYLARNWDSIRYSVGGYKLEEEGVRLFAQVQGDYFNVLGLPLLEILAYLGLQGVVDT